MRAEQKLRECYEVHKGYAYCLAGLRGFACGLSDDASRGEAFELIGFITAGLQVSNEEIKQAEEELK